MILIIKNEATEKSIIELQDYLADNNFFYEIIQGNNTKAMIVIGDTSLLDDNIVRSFDCVDDVKRITPAYKKVSRKYHPEDTIVEVNGIKIGGKENVVLLQNAFPTLEKYIDHAHVVNGKPVKVVENLKEEILMNFKYLMSLKKYGKNLFFPDIDKIKRIMLNELYNNN